MAIDLAGCEECHRHRYWPFLKFWNLSKVISSDLGDVLIVMMIVLVLVVHGRPITLVGLSTKCLTSNFLGIVSWGILFLALNLSLPIAMQCNMKNVMVCLSGQFNAISHFNACNDRPCGAQFNAFGSEVKQCNTMQCNSGQLDPIQNAMQCNAIKFNSIQYNTIKCNAMQCNTMQCNSMQLDDPKYNAM